MFFSHSMDEMFNKNAKVGQLTKMHISLEEEKGLIIKDPSKCLLSNLTNPL